MTQETSQTPIPQNEPVSTVARSAHLSRRVTWGLISLIAVTVGALWAAWRWPEQTSMHFWLVTQVVPVVYLFLAWWGVDTSSEDPDVV